MITFKLLIVIVAFGYAFSLPANKAAQNDAKTLPVPSINLSPPEITEPKLSRATRENKVEYIYLREGESPSLLPKHIYSTLKDEPAAAPLPFKDDEPKKPLDPSPKHNTENSVGSVPDKLHYDGGNSKGRLENPKGRSNAPILAPLVPPPLVPQPIVPINTYNPLNTCVNSCLNHQYQTIPYPYQPYPYQPYPASYPYQPYPTSYPIAPLTNSLNAYTSTLNNPLAGNQLQLLLGGNQPLLTLLLKSYLSNSRSSDITTDIMPAILSYVLANKAVVPLIGSALSSLILSPSLTNTSPQINPLLSYLLPQQTPNLNYLLKGNSDGLTGYENLAYPGIAPNLINSALYPGYYPQMYPVLTSYPQIAQGSLYPQMAQGSLYPQMTQGSLYPQMTQGGLYQVIPSYPILPGFTRSSSPNPSSSSDTPSPTPNNDNNPMTAAEPHDSTSVDKRFMYNPSSPLRTAFDPAFNYQYVYPSIPSRLVNPYRYPTYAYQSFPRYSAFPYPPAAAYYKSPLNLVPAYPANEIGFYSNFPEFARKNMDGQKSAGVAKDQSLGKDPYMSPYNNLYSMKGLKNDQSSLKEHHGYQDQPLDGNKIMMNEHKKA